jgi:hypothetical protein
MMPFLAAVTACVLHCCHLVAAVVRDRNMPAAAFDRYVAAHTKHEYVPGISEQPYLRCSIQHVRFS